MKNNTWYNIIKVKEDTRYLKKKKKSIKADKGEKKK